MEHQQHQPQPQPQNPGQDTPKQEWQSNLFNCAPCGTCLLSTCLPCILIGRTSGRMRDPSMETYEDLNSECMIFSAIHCLTGFGWVYAMMKRGEIRDEYGIEGSDCSDCCASYCCLCCVLIQSDKEVKLRTAGQRPIMQGYQSQKEGMQMPAPAGQQQQQQPMMKPEHQPELQQQQPQFHQPMQQQPMQHPGI
ncbi:PLAC8 family protein [Hirsutella rhossiliensis]|uniref:PLAC8 family domain-containing protein n=1 Tax=Hirsutella rhossiliensis TaxID=111463 RepID=A0A9P8SIB8_9HYPO|nr:PLAC8 family domain-containing protein [Hirsutella rhossiliensis]KAH0962450.1 PLAC8 family domain-containing protein [Hirsutella rhossiliensis]